MYPLHPMDALGADQLSMDTATMPASNGDGSMMQTGMDGTMDGMGGMGNMNGMMGMPMLNDPNAGMAFANPMMMPPNMYAGNMGLTGQMPDTSAFPAGPQDASAQQQQLQPSAAQGSSDQAQAENRGPDAAPTAAAAEAASAGGEGGGQAIDAKAETEKVAS